MVAKIVSGKSIRGLLNYNENKLKAGQASLILANRFGADLTKLDFNSKLNRFQHLTSLNSKVKTNAIHIMLNFDRQDKLAVPVLQQIAMDYMRHIGFDDQPYLTYLHKDAHHPHLHLVTTNLKSDGQRISIHNIGRTLSEAARKDIEKQYNLVRAEGRKNSEQILSGVNLEKAIYGEASTKKAINNVVNVVLKTYKFSTLAEYNAALGSFGVRADRGKEDTIMYEKRGLIYSIIDERGRSVGIPFKASALTNKPVLDSVEKKFEFNKEKLQPYKEEIKSKINQVLNAYSEITQSTFTAELRKSNIELILRKNEQGFIYGVTFVDHQNRSVFNGSALGKDYSAKGLIERFGNTDKLKTYLKQKPPSSYLKNESSRGSQSFLPSLKQTNYLEALLGKGQAAFGSAIPRKKKRRNKGRGL